MQLLILNWKDIKNPDVGGAEIILYELGKRLVKEGHQVTWFCRSFPNAIAEETIDGIKLVRRGNALTVYFEAFKYYRSLQRKPDKVLDCVNTICWQTPLYVEKKKRLAYVNQLAKEVLWYELPQPLSLFAYYLEKLEYLSYRDTNFICYSASTRDDLTTFGIPKKNIALFTIGMDHSRYTKGKKSLTPLFIFVARLVRMKRPELCVEAMEIIVKKFPLAQLAIVGYGPLEKKLQEMIKQKNLQKNVILVNKNNLFFKKNVKDQKTKLLKQSWSLLLPSVKEGWGLVITEAGACGTTSIVTNVTGLKDSVVKDQTGLIISAEPTADELVEAMTTIIQEKKLREKFSQMAYHYSKKFTWENSYRKFKDLLTK